MSETSLDQRPIAHLSWREVEADPHGVFKRCRLAAPFVAHERGGYVVLRSSDVEALARDTTRVRRLESLYARWRGLTEGAVFDGFEYGVFTANGPAHRRRRAPFTRAYGARLVTELRPQIRQLAHDLIDPWHQDGAVDLVERFSLHLPVRASARLLGLPESDVGYFTKLIHSVSRVLRFPAVPEEQAEIETSATEMRDYIAAQLDARRQSPGDDFLSAYVADADQKGEMSPVEIIYQIFILSIAGADPTHFGLAVEIALLLQHREQWQAVCGDPGLVPAAVAEALRYEPGFASISRLSTEDIELDGHILPAGQLVTLSMMSGLRDEQCYDRPDSFDIHRTDRQRVQLGFGAGQYRCLGEGLAKIVLEEGLAAITERLPQLQLSQGMPKLQGHIGMREISELRVTWRN